MIEKFIELLQFLIELKENKCIPEKFEKEYERNINFIKKVIENPKRINNKNFKSLVASMIAFFATIFNPT